MTSSIIASALVNDRQTPGQYRHIQLPDASSVLNTCQLITHWWDLDHTLIQTDADPLPQYIESTSNNYHIHPDILHRQEQVHGIITQRNSAMADDTIALLKSVSIYPDIIIFNPETRTDEQYVDHWISKILHISGAIAYITDDAQRQHRCMGWWPALIQSVSRCVWGGV